MCVCVCACVLSCVRLFAALWTVAFQGPLFMGFLQARILEQVAISYSRGTSRPRDQTHFSSIDKLIPYHCANWNPNSLFGNPMGCSPPGSSVHEISQARILEWVSNFSPLSVMLTIGVFDRYSFSNWGWFLLFFYWGFLKSWMGVDIVKYLSTSINPLEKETTTLIFLPEKSHGQRSLAGCSR